MLVCLYACEGSHAQVTSHGEGGGGWEGGGDDDDIGTQTPRTISPQEPFYSVLQYFRDGGPSSMMMVDDGDHDDDDA